MKKPQVVSPQSVPRASFPPEQLRAAASARVLRIQASIAALQPEDTEEMEALQRALTKAQRQMVVPPIDQQIVATEEYVTRVQKRLQKHDVSIAEARKALEEAERAKETDVRGLADAENLLQRLRRQATEVPVHEPVLPSEVVSLQQRVQQLQTERDSFAKMVQEQVQESPLKRGRVLREDFVPHTDEELAQWMYARQSERKYAGWRHWWQRVQRHWKVGHTVLPT